MHAIKQLLLTSILIVGSSTAAVAETYRHSFTSNGVTTTCTTSIVGNSSRTNCYDGPAHGFEYESGDAFRYLKRNLEGVNSDGSKVNPVVQGLRLVVGTVVTSPFLVLDAVTMPFQPTQEEKKARADAKWVETQIEICRDTAKQLPYISYEYCVARARGEEIEIPEIVYPEGVYPKKFSDN